MRAGNIKYGQLIFSYCLLFIFSFSHASPRSVNPPIKKRLKFQHATPTFTLPKNDVIKYATASCNTVNWAVWTNFVKAAATGTITDEKGKSVSVNMTANFDFDSTPTIYGYNAFPVHSYNIPNATVPRTTWAAGPGGLTTMCFSEKVLNPVLLLSSLGSSAGVSAKLYFSVPYVVLFDGGGMVYDSSTALTGTEGNAIIMFPGEFSCVNVNSTTPEFYSNITWGLRPPPFPINIKEDATGCGSATLTASGGVSYLWNGGDTPDKPTNTFHTSGTYIVTVTDASGCSTSASKTVTVVNGFTININGKTTGCESVSLTASGGIMYKWDEGDTPDKPTNTFHKSGTYTVTVTNTNGCTNTLSKTVTIEAVTPVITGDATGCGSLPLTASGGVTYFWDGGDTPNAATNTFRKSGTYNVTVTNADGCSAPTSKTIVVNTPPVPVITNTVSDCGSTTLTAGGGVSYTWDGGQTPGSATNTFTTAGTYHVTITDVNGCMATLSKIVTVNQPPIAVISGSTTGCDNVTLIASGGVSYTWDGGNTPNSATNTFTTGGTYHVIVKGANNWTSSATAIVTISNSVQPSVSITASPAGPVCPGTAVSFNATPVNGGNLPAFEWFKNGVSVTTGSTYTATDLLNNDIITCSLTSNATCAIPATVTSNTINAAVTELPAILFNGNLTIEHSDKIELNPIITGNVQTYLWAPAIGLNDPTMKNPIASPDLTTRYILTVTSPQGCQDTAGVTIKVLQRDIIIPNTFTPNGDGINDTWNITYLPDYPDASVNIYDRWGTLVFHSTGYPKAWDGKYNGKLLPVGTYYYIIDLKYDNAKAKSGWLALLK